MKYTLEDFEGQTEIVVPEDATEVDVSFSKIKSLDVSNCKKLNTLECCHTFLTSLDVRNCKDLKYLNCANTPLTSLDVSKCKELEFLHCYNTPATSLDTYIDVRNCKKLLQIDNILFG